LPLHTRYSSQITRQGRVSQILRLETSQNEKSVSFEIAGDQVKIHAIDDQKRILAVLEYDPGQQSFQKIKEIAIRNPIVAFQDQAKVHQSTHLYTGDENQVFWFEQSLELREAKLFYTSQFSVKSLDVYILQEGMSEPERHTVSAGSILKQHILSGNDVFQNSEGLEFSLTSATPKIFQNMIVFAHSKWGTTPSVYFYDLEAKREIVRVAGCSMLLHYSAPKAFGLPGNFLFFSDPSMMFETIESKEVFESELAKNMEMANELRHKYPTMKRFQIDFEAAKGQSALVEFELANEIDEMFE